MTKLLKLFSALLLAVATQAQPQRIVSTLPSATETLFALGLGNNVVGVSIYCNYPPVVLSLPKVGTYTKPDAEKIALLHPDLVVIPATASGLADRMSALNIRTVRVKIGSLLEIYSMIDDIGAGAGVPDKAERLNNEIRSRLETVRAEGASHPGPTALLVVGRTPGLLSNLVVAGPSTYLSELLKIAGGSNVLVDSMISYPRISLETVVRLNPDVIFDLSTMGHASNQANQQNRLRQPWLSHRELAAVRTKNVFGLVSEALVTPGPRVVEAVEEIRSQLRTAVPQKVVQ